MPITERVLIQRLNRKLKGRDLIIKRCSAYSPVYGELGDYFVLDFACNLIVQRRLVSIDLESMGRAKNVLADWEIVEN